MKPKILASLAAIAVVVAVAGGATVAYFSDTEKSTGNTLAAGTIDLKVSNDSYVTNAEGVLVASPNTSWQSDDLTVQKFFNFTDIKPGDVGEDTIDLRVGTNPAWACAKLTLTSNSDVTCTDPEDEAEGGHMLR